MLLAESGNSAIAFIEWATLISVVAIIAVSHVLHLLHLHFHWPKWLATLHEKDAHRNVSHVLQDLGLDDSVGAKLRQATLREAIAAAAQHNNPKDRCIELMKRFTNSGRFDVGDSYSKMYDYFVDLISASVDLAVADACAGILVSYLKEDCQSNFPDFDFVIGLKEGAPTIACAFAARTQKSVALFRGRDHYRVNKSEKRAIDLFDGNLPVETRVLIVDDSTTGGRKVLECIEALRSMNCKVAHCLVLFEPLGKDARSQLGEKGVDLISVVRMDKTTLSKLNISANSPEL